MFKAVDVLRYVGYPAYEKGLRYNRQDRGLIETIEPGYVAGTVKGSNLKPYNVKIFLEKGSLVDGSCDCPSFTKEGCKHFATLAFAALSQFSERQKSLVMGENKRKTAALDLIGELVGGQKDSRNKMARTNRLRFLMRVNPDFDNSKDKAFERLQVRPGIFNPISGKTHVSKINWKDYSPYAKPSWEEYTKRGDWNFFKEVALTIDVENSRANMSGKLGWAPVLPGRSGLFWQLFLKSREEGIGFETEKEGIGALLPGDSLVHEVVLSDNKEHGVLQISEEIVQGDEHYDTSKALAVGFPPVFGVLYNSDRQLLAIAPFDTKDPRSSRGITPGTFYSPQLFTKEEAGTLEKEYLRELVKTTNIQIRSKKISAPQISRPILTVSVASGRKKKGATHSLKITHEITYEGMSVSHKNSTSESVFVKKKEIVRDIDLEHELLREVFDLYKGSVLSIPENITMQFLEGQIPEAYVVYDFDAVKTVEFVSDWINKRDDIAFSVHENVPEFFRDLSAPEIKYNIASQEKEGDWFDLSILIQVGGEEVPFKSLFLAIAQDEDIMVLPSGRYFDLAHDSFKKLRHLIEESKETNETTEEGIQVSKFQAGFWKELEALGIVGDQAKEWKNSMQSLLSTKSIEKAETSDSLNAKLRGYQEDGFSWLAFLHGQGLGGVLGDDMGLGKTVQVIALIGKILEDAKEDIAPFLIVAPTSVVAGWELEFQKFAPSVNVVAMTAGDRTKDLAALRSGVPDVIVTSYSLLTRDIDHYMTQIFTSVIMDEAQYVKNHTSKTYRNIRLLKAQSRFALSGTPMENNTLELWSLFSIVAPGLFGGPKHFKKHFQNPIEKDSDNDTLIRLKARIKPFFMRRTKDKVAKDLPSKTEHVVMLPLDSEHEKIYQVHLQRERQRILGLLSGGEGGLKKNRFKVLSALTKLRQLAIHPGLVDSEKFGEMSSVKLERTIDQVKMIRAQGSSVLVFSQFVSFLKYVKKALDKEEVPYFYLDGSTKNRKELIEDFQASEDGAVFLISLKAGGSGITLTNADYCIILDPWWNPAVEQQAIDRTHRIGQTKPVVVQKFIAKGTIEEKVLKLQERKKNLFDSVLNEGGVFESVLDEGDIRDLLESM